MKTKSTLFNLLIRETSHFLCYERLLNKTYVANKNAFFREMQFWSHCYTVVSYQALFRLSVYKIPAVYLSGAKNVCFCTIRDFGSPTNIKPCHAVNFYVLHSCPIIRAIYIRSRIHSVIFDQCSCHLNSRKYNSYTLLL